MRALAAGLLLVAIGAPLPAHAADDTPTYAQCLAKIQADPDQAFEDALAWHDMGGGVPARHCQTMALIALGHYGEAASRLEALAREPGAGDARARAEILAQAGNAWILAREAQHAYNALSAALELVPREPDYLYDRARASALGEDFRAARDDLDTLITIVPRDGEAFALRASARRSLGDLAGARADADQAVRLSPKDPDGWLERGTIRHFQGDEEGAGADWRKALTLDPDSAAGKAAQAILERKALGLPIDPAAHEDARGGR